VKLPSVAGAEKGPDADAEEAKRLPRTSRRGRLVAGCVFALTFLLVLLSWVVMIRMPASSFAGPLPALTEAERDLSKGLRKDVRALAVDIGERNGRNPLKLRAAAAFIEAELKGAGYDEVRKQSFGSAAFVNLEVEIRGTTRPAEVVVVGAHYDSAWGTPAANDNASGVAALLALSRAWATKRFDRSLRLVAFASEEPPHFQTAEMGSLVYAKSLREAGVEVVAMLSLETMGYYRGTKGSQQYPFPLSVFYPDVGNFIAVVGDLSSRSLVHQVIASLRSHTQFPTEGAALPSGIPGVGWSDHWSFWQHGYPGVMISDTAPFRYPHYHTPDDTIDKIDFAKLARVVAGLQRVVVELLAR